MKYTILHIYEYINYLKVSIHVYIINSYIEKIIFLKIYYFKN